MSVNNTVPWKAYRIFLFWLFLFQFHLTFSNRSQPLPRQNGAFETSLKLLNFPLRDLQKLNEMFVNKNDGHYNVATGTCGLLSNMLSSFQLLAALEWLSYRLYSVNPECACDGPL